MEYAVELFVGRPDASHLYRVGRSAQEAALELERRGTRVRYVRSLLVPEDETCLLVYEAESADAVARALRLAELPFERVVEALTLDAPLL